MEKHHWIMLAAAVITGYFLGIYFPKLHQASTASAGP
jgi:uncharacterized membrane protein YozB (DUF420 family)